MLSATVFSALFVIQIGLGVSKSIMAVILQILIAK
jgi:hypothetical protein